MLAALAPAAWAAPSYTISRIAGNGSACANPLGGCGDGGAATSAEVDLPTRVFVDSNGNVVIGGM
jgi:hypothetical protein